MNIMSRRVLMQGLSVGAVLPALATVPHVLAQAAPSIPQAFAADHSAKPLAFDPTAIEGLSERMLMSHWENNYGGSVTALNAVKQRLATALADDDLPAYIYNDLKREHLLRTGSVVLHEYYFDNIGGSGARDSQFDAALTSAFGSAATWEREFRRIGAGLGGGSGWVMLAWNAHARTLENYWMWDHMHAPAAALPLLVMDMYEHSYQMDYGAATARYIDAFMRNINWTEVSRRMDLAMRA